MAEAQSFAGPPPREPAPIASSPAIAQLRRRLDAATADEAAAILVEFWGKHQRTPLLEHLSPGSTRPAECIVTFLWRDDPSSLADAVRALVTGFYDEQQPEASDMQRLEDTDLWHLSYRVRTDLRASYGFEVRRGGTWQQLTADPRGGALCDPRTGPALSVVELPDAPAQPWLERRDEPMPRGIVSRHLGPAGRYVWLYSPPQFRFGSDPGDPTAHPVLSREAEPLPRPMPVIVLFDGEVWAHRVADTLDNLIDDGLIRPSLVVMPESGDREQRAQWLGSGGQASDWVANELLPWVRSVAPVSAQPDEVVIAGQGLGAFTALRVVLEHPECAGAVLCQSAGIAGRELRAAAPDLVHRVHAYVEVGTHEHVLRGPNRELASVLVAAGADVHYVEYNGAHDFACWRGGIADGIRALVGPPQ